MKIDISRYAKDSIKKFLINRGVVIANVQDRETPLVLILGDLFKRIGIDMVFDVGANKGQYARLIRSRVGFHGPIVSFEPIPTLANDLMKSAANDPAWHVRQAALSSSNGSAEFHVMNSSDFSSLSMPSEKDTSAFHEMNSIKENIIVKTQTIESIFDDLKHKFSFQNPFLKLDTQGFDMEVIKGAGRKISSFPLIQIELSIKKLYEHSVDFADALEILKNIGFSPVGFIPLAARDIISSVELDGIFVRSDL